MGDVRATPMNKASMFLFFAIVAAVCATAQIFYTNRLGRSEAVKIASRLTAGMRESDARRFMETNGLTFGYTVGGTLGGTCFYKLSDGCDLDLEISIEPGTWTNRVLTAVALSSNNVKIFK